MNKHSNLIAIILCGGKSLRMGRDKGLLVSEEKTWAETIFHKLEFLKIPVFLSINEGQLENYSKLISSKYLIIDDSLVPGPLGGILSSHKKFPEIDFLILACDMQDISKPIIENLYEEYLLKKSFFENFVFALNGTLHPFPTIVSAFHLKQISLSYIKRSLQNYSMKNMLKSDKTYTISLGLGQDASFKNCNYPEDIY